MSLQMAQNSHPVQPTAEDDFVANDTRNPSQSTNQLDCSVAVGGLIDVSGLQKSQL